MKTQKLAKVIEAARKRRGWTKAEAARRCDMHAQSYGVVERGDHYPSIGTLLKVAKAFGLKLVVELVEKSSA